MTLATFDFPFHGAPIDEYPESSVIVQFGKGYRYAANSRGPDQVVFTLSFAAMVWYVDDEGVIDRTKNAQYNMAKLIDFYEEHKLHKYFTYPHPSRGNVRVRFYKPIKVPKTKPSMSRHVGVTESFDVQLILEPQ